MHGGRLRLIINGLKSVVVICGEATPLFRGIKIRCCDMGRGYASFFGGLESDVMMYSEGMPHYQRIKIR